MKSLGFEQRVLMARDMCRKGICVSTLHCVCMHIWTIVGIYDNEIVAYGAVVIESKIRGESAGHIEDIVVDNKVRGKRIGVDLIKELVKIAKEKRCYRVTLFCDESLVNFYDKNGFGVSGTAMKVHLVN